ncbi:arsenite efflux transporter metallochaperone ArsD [Salinibacter altiplanensis]|uniref:arsenite efflux transporter metallochaperone ArsD n=1 Tax=Salinibacter altiplanensis TaxID=1803181 RepID=UPI000C9FD51F|nr:arsenite efflux transporter metallochaperone ArsD [Salinibacter altiplanensis]
MPDSDASDDALKSAVHAKYAALATGREACCGPSGCGDTDLAVDMSEDYADAVAADADLDLGCGRPTDHAHLQPGERVLDLGSGAGMDAFVARRDVGLDGHVHGVDFTEEMVEKARANANELGYENVTFEIGDIEDLPVEDDTFDVILSNCVLNLVPDKERAFAEMARVLRPGGRFSVSDIVHVGTLPDGLREAAEMYVGCVAGAMERSAYLDGIRGAGFTDVEGATDKTISLPDDLLAEYLDTAEIGRFRTGDAELQSITVVGRRPETRDDRKHEAAHAEPPADSVDGPEIEVFDPPMCCSTGVCGPEADDELVTVSEVLRKLERRGATVERYNPASHPEMFTDTPVVYDALQREGQDVLPIVLVDGRVQSRWSYPSREEFAHMAGLEPA